MKNIVIGHKYSVVNNQIKEVSNDLGISSYASTNVVEIFEHIKANEIDFMFIERSYLENECFIKLLNSKDIALSKIAVLHTDGVVNSLKITKNASFSDHICLPQPNVFFKRILLKPIVKAKLDNF